MCIYCSRRIKEINDSDLADNQPKHPRLQDLDIWTKDQMREWIKDHADMPEFITNNRNRR